MNFSKEQIANLKSIVIDDNFNASNDVLAIAKSTKLDPYQRALSANTLFYFPTLIERDGDGNVTTMRVFHEEKATDNFTKHIWKVKCITSNGEIIDFNLANLHQKDNNEKYIHSIEGISGNTSIEETLSFLSNKTFCTGDLESLEMPKFNFVNNAYVRDYNSHTIRKMAVLKLLKEDAAPKNA